MKKLVLLLFLFITSDLFAQKVRKDLDAGASTLFFYDLDRTDPQVDTLFLQVHALLGLVKNLDTLPKGSPVYRQATFREAKEHRVGGQYSAYFEHFVISEGPGFVCIHNDYPAVFGPAFNFEDKKLAARQMNTFLRRLTIEHTLAK